ncbi:hypothetical protein SISNIDRAFT_486749 [Sistotremastrum niveocremeum HHB9708]|uniref:Uncharacterized protein n=1 Tax=Sistotremastrum niveocremeum HHB9708 TaxID=1314777 RepID=A0A164TAQ2_9AGAM|nr:hypothetical protein SISNIDRAFT_486749 [Sistotremastrum niveocremeum HHB9708]
MFHKIMQSVFLFLVLACSISARILSIQSTSGQSAKVGDNYNITFNTASHIQNWADYSVLIGWAVHPLPDPISPGAFFGSAIDLTSIGKVATGLGNFSTEVFIDPVKFDITTVTTYTLNAAITSVIGASLETSVRFLNTTITIEP